MSLLLKNARVLTMDPADTEHERADILIEGSRIAAIGPELEAPPVAGLRIVEAGGWLALPGLVNGHLHSSSVLSKGAYEGAPLDIAMLFMDAVTAAEFATERFCYLRTLLAAIDMLKQGVTAVRDDPWCMPMPTAASVAGIMRAYGEVGMRAEVTLGLGTLREHDTLPFGEGELPAAIRAELDRAPIPTLGALLDLYRDSVERWHGSAGGRVKVAVTCSAPQRVAPDHMVALHDFARRHGLSFEAHVLETKTQRVAGRMRHGQSLLQHMGSLGVLDERTVVIHAVWTDAADWRLLAERGCTVAHNPISNLRLGSGVMRFREMAELGIPICLGTDQHDVDESNDLWVVARTAALLAKIADPDEWNWPPATAYLRALTNGGARAMGLAERTGMLAPGREADILLVDLASLPYQPLRDLRRQLLYGEVGGSVRMTIVAGRVVVEDGRILTLDEAALREELRGHWPRYLAAYEKAMAEAARLLPIYRGLYRRLVAEDVGFTRWLGA
jgi:5-methylthioadenosine/S-adenosylhomocysteine deaminase